jgi:hypothetical protein
MKILKMGKKMEPKQFIQVANSYIERGFSVIPVGVDKKPMVKWEQYQSRKATADEVERWSKLTKKPNIAIVTGRISGIIVVDVEAGGSIEGYTPTVIANTGGGGWHFYYKHPGYEIKNSARKLRELTDIRGDGGYVVVPPSLHKSGKHYDWSASPETSDFADIPDWVLQTLAPAKTESHEANDWEQLLAQDNNEGNRNDMAAKVAGYLLRTVNKPHWDSTGWASLVAWNLAHNKPSLPEQELRQVWDSIKHRAEAKPAVTKIPPAQVLVEAIEASGAVLFHDQYNEPHIAYDGNGSNVSKVHSNIARLWLVHYGHTQLGKVPSSDAVNRALETLAARAHFDGEQHALEVRSVYNKEGLWYDLGSSAVHVTPKHWEVTEQPPIIFRRFSHQKNQVVPRRGGDLRILLDYINIADEAEKLLFLVYVVAAFIPDYPHPLLILHGIQGAGKTTPMMAMKELIDPSALKEGFSLPTTVSEFAQIANHHYFLFFDNLSTMPEWFSDTLARAVTGGSFSKREHYTNDDDVIYRFQRTIAQNSINQVVYKSDLLDRSILIHLDRISEEKRKPSQLFWAEFERDLPDILGAIFDVLVKALALHPTLKLDKSPRMADFILWGCAIAEAAGYSGEAFKQAYYANIATQHDEAIEANPVAQVIMEFIRDLETWTGTPSELLALLFPIAIRLEVSQSRYWPKDAPRLGKALEIITPNLAAKGIGLERSRAQQRLITISNSAVVTDVTDVTPVINVPGDDSTTATTAQSGLP